MALEDSHIANELVVVGDGVRALDYLFGTGNYAGRNIADTPQVILLDLKLPKLNGLEVLQRLRSDPRTALIPIVVLTSSSVEEDILASYKLGANSYVRKPVDFNEFASAVKSLGCYWMLLNLNPPENKQVPCLPRSVFCSLKIRLMMPSWLYSSWKRGG